ncbi:cellulase family glycosylhydrolase [Tichowtungia aerotolerans]|uniref:Cellulase family glycosylhydrolase n=1 Tax=Tichowtungia aerotolerans TaxID=2697043 RepID=A0A6P1MCM9_9BACT|nr:cellulase family glycosylhydrolase [Tichowtungia aerotolerans]QHI68845.1 cellulase family glycosylhydrolase [Tichowtungia aerotolerans]
MKKICLIPFLCCCGLSVGWSAGLTVSGGQLMRNGTPYRAMGVNYHNCFSQLLSNPKNRDYEKGFVILRKKYRVPFIRFMAGPFHDQGWKLYDQSPSDYFARLDLIVHEAEKRELGLIPSLFWSVVAVPDYMNEPLSALGDADSRSRGFIRRYATDIVTRYKDSPAVFGWEFGNEYMLFADLPKLDHLPPPKKGTKTPRTAADKLTRPMLLDLYEDFYRTVRSIDPERIIVTGDSIARSAAWHNSNQDCWGHDSRAQWLEQFASDTPDCFEVASFHLYEEADGSYFKGEKPPLGEVVAAAVQECRRNNRVVWCGELGMPGSDDYSREIFFRMMQAVEDNCISLSAIWNFIPSGRYQPDWDILPDHERVYMLEAVRKLNDRYAVGEWK